MIDVLAGLRIAGDRPIAAGADAFGAHSDDAKSVDQAKINGPDESVNNRAADDDRKKRPPREETFDAALANATQEKGATSEPSSMTRGADSASSIRGKIANDVAGSAGAESEKFAAFPDLFALGDSLAIIPPDQRIKAATIANTVFNGTLETKPMEALAAAAFGENIAGAGGFFGPLGAADALIVGFSGAGRGLGATIEPRMDGASAANASVKFQPDPLAFLQQALQRAGAFAIHAGALADGAVALDVGSEEILDAEGVRADSQRRQFVKLFQQLNFAASSATTAAGFDAFAAARGVQASIQVDFKNVTELGPVEFGATRLHEALVQTSAPVQQSAAATPAMAAQIVAAFRADRIGNSVEVRLDPPELGRVRIEFAVETADAVKAVVTAERTETLDYLRRNAAHLTSELRSAGFGSIELEFADRQEKRFDAKSGEFGIDIDGEPIASPNKESMIYLTLRDHARLDMLV